MNQQFEYKVTEIKQWFLSKPLSNNISKHLNEISAKGWELVDLISSIGFLEIPSYVRFIWRKPKS
ncbi:MAG: DUF4177 domain-containing protein [Candidatus Celaenobacter antarcticus]|nr:DUF4177 domain-containing protein [Candidatus Celaenobacter antarcticus]